MTSVWCLVCGRVEPDVFCLLSDEDVSIDDDFYQALLRDIEIEHEHNKLKAKSAIIDALDGMSMEDCTVILGEVLITLRTG